MEIKSLVPENTCCDMRDSWNIISKLSNDFGVIVHGPSGCENDFFYSDKFFHSHSFTTNLNEFDITMGTGYDKLLNKIEYVISNFSEIKVLFILGTCSSELIGDDIDNIKDNLSTDVEVIIIHTSGMRGGGYHYTKFNIFKSLFNIFDKSNLLYENKKKINIFFQDGMQNDSFRQEIIKFLSIFGIKVNSFLNSNISLDELKTINNVDCNYLIGRDSDFLILLDYIKKDFGINYKILDLPVGLKSINKFYFTITSDFLIDKKQYVIEFLKYKVKFFKNINKIILKKYFNDIYLKTNLNLYGEMLNEIGLSSSLIDRVNYNKGINSSHKFNYSNKIIISCNKIGFNQYNLYGSKSFNTINKYMGFIGLNYFYDDIKNQYYYNNFLNKYHKYF